MKSNVYFAKAISSSPQDRIGALQRILAQCAELMRYKNEEIVPVKITIGDVDCVYQVSPELVKTVVETIRAQQAKPFLFDTSVLYHGMRQNAVGHTALAQRKGYGYEKIGAPFIVADGVLGNDGKEFYLEAGHIKKVRVPSFVGMLESLVVLSHATGHIVSGYAGAIKNVAMGMSCRATKQVQHSSLKPNVITEKCTSCGCCIKICPVQAISLKEKKAFIDQSRCIGCGECLCACTFNAVSINWEEDPVIFCKRMVEVAHFVSRQFKKVFCITFAFDITKECDCMSHKNEKMAAQNIGILASSDMVSLDKATVDLALRHKVSDFFPDTKKVYTSMLEYAGHKGLGNLEYRLVEV
ncbi:MAG: DUF362 domain-containing protein [Candidatus Omnitrophica bacterium]|nr:DUF362 domain-containing protein [Candidatus Omnitrophota bacterium]